MIKLYAITPLILQTILHYPCKFYLSKVLGIKVKYDSQILKTNGPFIFACNHRSDLDPVILTTLLPLNIKIKPMFFVSKVKSAYKNTGIKSFIYGGKFFKALGSYPAITGLNDYEKSLATHIKILNDGHNICIFPQGKKANYIDIEMVKGGVIYLAEKTNSKIIPVKIIDKILSLGESIDSKKLISESENTPQNRSKYYLAAVKLMKIIEELD